MIELPAPVAFALAAMGVTAIGVAAAAARAPWTQAQAGLIAAFAAGSLICVAILHLVPEALAASAAAPAWILAGFGAAYLIDRGALGVRRGKGGAGLAGALAPTLAIAAHSFIDGVAYAVAFSASWATGALAAVGLMLHELPEGVIVFSLLLRAGASPLKASALALATAGAATPLGAALAWPVAASLDTAALGALFAVAAGALLYLGAVHLLPHAEREPVERALPALALGALLSIGGAQLHQHVKPHGHVHAAAELAARPMFREPPSAYPSRHAN